MNRKPKTIKMTVDGTPYISNLAPETIDDFDGHCPACGSPKYVELCTIVQHGFILSDCTTLITCATCFETFHYNYQVDDSIMGELNTVSPDRDINL